MRTILDQWLPRLEAYDPLDCARVREAQREDTVARRAECPGRERKADEADDRAQKVSREQVRDALQALQHRFLSTENLPQTTELLEKFLSERHWSRL
jgi:hypothetical protein